MPKSLLSLTAGIVLTALIFTGCFGGDDEADAQAQAQATAQAQAEAQAEAQAAAQAEAHEEAQAQAQAEPTEQAQEPAAEEQAQAEEPVEQAVEEEQAVSDLPPDQLEYGGQIRSSVITPDEPAQFRFEGSEGDLVRIRVDGLNGMDPVTTLQEPNRTDILTNDD